MARLLGHEQISTTLTLYTRSTRERFGRVREVLADDSLTSISPEDPQGEDDLLTAEDLDE
ncbi:hypothetical protein ACIBH1_20735 [Nonomuraea sp. NPDC050663]|uniref:hypothetical protein n=1 Tax=Nonomuraea sp. NPDC050663 TaxID=3364370 RepID=UPI00378B5256